MASTNEFQGRVLDFEAATTAELASLMANGMTSRAAVRELEGRLVGSREDPASAGMLPLDVVAAAQLAARLNLSVDDAKRVLMVKRQMGMLRASGMSDSAAAHQLQSRVQLAATAQLPPPVAQPSTSPVSLPKPAPQAASAAPAAYVPAFASDPKLSAISAPQSSGGGLPPPMARSTSGTTSPGLSPATAAAAARGRPAPISATTAASVASSVAVATEVAASIPSSPSLKRSRSSENGRSSSNNNNSAARPEPIVAAEKVELARQLSALTSEINDAMRAGDRAKVVLLMRRRDQLRRNGAGAASSAAIVSDKPTANGEIADGKPKADGKRARQGSPRS